MCLNKESMPAKLRRNSWYHRSIAVSALLMLLTLSAPFARAAAMVRIGNPQDAGALPAAIRAAYRNGARIIVINPGMYRLPATGRSTFHLNHWKHVTIRARKVTFIMRVAHGGNCFVFDHCRHVVLDGPTITQTQVTFYQGRVVKVARAPGGYDCDWKPDAGYPVPDNADKSFPTGFDVVDGKSRRLRVGSGDISANRHTQLPGGIFQLFFHMNRQRFKVGDWLVARWGNPHTKILLLHSRHCTIRHVTLIRNGFAPIFEVGGGGNHLLYCHWTLGPPPVGAVQLPVVTNQADGFHSVNADPGTDIEHCTFSGVFLDDCIAIHGEFQTVLAANGVAITIKDNRNSGLRAGGPIQISSKTGYFAVSHVLAVSRLSNATSVITLARRLPVPVGAYVTNPDRCGKGYRVIDCTLGDTRSRGMLLKGSDGIVIGNTVRGCGMAGISIGPEFWWREAGYCRNVIVEDNRLIHDGKGGRGPGFAAVFVHGDGAIGNSHIVIRHNTFIKNYGGDIFMQWTADGIISGNRFTAPGLIPATGSYLTPAITIKNARHIYVADNHFTNPAQYAARSTSPQINH